MSGMEEECEEGGQNEEGTRVRSNQVRSGEQVFSLFWPLRRSTLNFDAMFFLAWREKEGERKICKDGEERRNLKKQVQNRVNLSFRVSKCSSNGITEGTKKRKKQKRNSFPRANHTIVAADGKKNSRLIEVF